MLNFVKNNEKFCSVGKLNVYLQPQKKDINIYKISNSYDKGRYRKRNRKEDWC